MATPAVVPLPSTSSSALFATAIDRFLADVAQKDAKSPFCQAITALRNQSASAPNAAKQDSQQCADELLVFVRDVAAKRKQGSVVKVMGKLEPFVSSLTGLARFCEGLMQASPMAVGIIFAGARVILTVRINLMGPIFPVLDMLMH